MLLFRFLFSSSSDVSSIGVSFSVFESEFSSLDSGALIIRIIFWYGFQLSYVGLLDETSSGPDFPLPTLIWILVWAIFIFLLTGDPAVFSPNIPSSSSSSVFRIGLSRKTGSESSLADESVFEDSSFWTSVVSVTKFSINHKIRFLSLSSNPISHHLLSFCL